ncbi:unnamed protein product [Miscanthus lutarioriparius]|uniref:Uncharacterized protein n=1 Tax=Miscanthus lutarioriparius TaxID=422564 RepID=A0A811SBG1_9POAL|nr:unnamed protein product [Miscanthus lutarioriparius]
MKDPATTPRTPNARSAAAKAISLTGAPRGPPTAPPTRSSSSVMEKAWSTYAIPMNPAARVRWALASPGCGYGGFAIWKLVEESGKAREGRRRKLGRRAKATMKSQMALSILAVVAGS